MGYIVTKAASLTKIVSPVTTIVSAVKSKTTVPTSPITAKPVIVSIAPSGAAAVAAKTTVNAPGSDTVQPAQTGKITKVKTTSPATARPSYVTYY